MLKKSVLVTGIFIISRVVLLATQIVVTRLFGASLELDMYLAAVALPTIAITVVYSTLNDVFLARYIPILKKDNIQGHAFFTQVCIYGIGFSLLVTILVSMGSYAIAYGLYGHVSVLFAKQVGQYLQYLIWVVPFGVAATLGGAYYYARKRFLRFPIAQLVGSVVNVTFIILLAPIIDIWALVMVFILQIVVQIFFIIPDMGSYVTKKVLQYRLVVPLFVAWIPLIVGNVALRSDILLIQYFGTHLGEGYLVYLNIIFKMFSFAAGVMTIGIQTVFMPHLVEDIAHGGVQRVLRSVFHAKAGALGISALTAVAVYVLAPPVIHMLYVGNKFSIADGQQAIALLPYFIIPGVGWGLVTIFVQPLIALHHQWMVGVISAGALACGWIAALIIEPIWGPLMAMVIGLSVLLYGIVVMSEIVWTIEVKKTKNKQ